MCWFWHKEIKCHGEKTYNLRFFVVCSGDTVYAYGKKALVNSSRRSPQMSVQHANETSWTADGIHSDVVFCPQSEDIYTSFRNARTWV